MLARQAVGQLAHDRLGQGVERGLHLAQVGTSGVTVRRDLLGRPDDRLRPARLRTAQYEAEQLPQVAAAPVRLGAEAA